MPHIAVNFHYVGMQAYPHSGIHGLSSGDFKNSLLTLAREYDFISLQQVNKMLRDGDTCSGKVCLITLDDGLLCQYEEALPVLDEVNAPAAFFALGNPYVNKRAATVHKLQYIRATCGDAWVVDLITKMPGDAAQRYQSVDAEKAQDSYRYDTPESARLKYFLNYHEPAAFTESVVDRALNETGLTEERFIAGFYMTPAMLKSIAQRGMLGSHAMSHRPLSQLPPQDAKAELETSKQALTELTGCEIGAVSYPLGNANAVNRQVAGFAADCGYTAGWSMERAMNTTMQDPLLFARFDAADINGTIEQVNKRSRYIEE